eukprot:784897-Prorocentrum_lima.AAC.1
MEDSHGNLWTQLRPKVVARRKWQGSFHIGMVLHILEKRPNASQTVQNASQHVALDQRTQTNGSTRAC